MGLSQCATWFRCRLDKFEIVIMYYGPSRYILAPCERLYRLSGTQSALDSLCSTSIFFISSNHVGRPGSSSSFLISLRPSFLSNQASRPSESTVQLNLWPRSNPDTVRLMRSAAEDVKRDAALRYPGVITDPRRVPFPAPLISNSAAYGRARSASSGDSGPETLARICHFESRSGFNLRQRRQTIERER